MIYFILGIVGIIATILYLAYKILFTDWWLL